ncbi:DUF4926 domain-containing protein [Candidatus Mycobacterium methanotrophicum]|uniref:DUF4926 domain-containing protein n=1 Tax=Candidatus Mycobacterium methanotrophicum TaxID=2943498 RepID=A0ABY4QM91_9MYCO|nr:DUF4926 domain-containing protein [Candidatus Mycobacterium methanotrophicum]UQX11070.1 DUF4926 domain-containing protein [Candidatus Mycobacterium methanotrophicum]
MRNENDSRDRIAYLRQLAVESLTSYSGGFAELERIDRDLKSIIWALDEIADRSWTSSLIGQWGYLEATYASALARDRNRLTDEEEVDLQRVVADLLANFKGYEVPLSAEDKPRENDIVRLLRPLPERNLPAGSTGTVVVDYTEYSDGALPAEYEVDFANSEDSAQILVTVSDGDIELVSRPRYGNSPSYQQ